MTKELVKQDINFLENPLWFQDEKLATQSQDGYVWQDNDGFIYRAGYKPPVKTDMIFLLYILIQSQKQGWAEEIQLTRYQIINECGIGINDWWYDRLEDSLKRWKMVGIEFHGTFYDKRSRLTMMFGIIDEWEIDKETKILKIQFSKSYLRKVRESTFFRYVDFEQLKALRSPLATRLYEILVKTFKDRLIWEIDAIGLAQKIPMNEKYPAHILLKIKPAINRINSHTDLKLALHVRKKKRGETILIFEKLVVQKQRKQHAQESFVIPENEEFKKLITMLPWERQSQKTLLELILRAFNKHGFDYVAWNIQYANDRAIGNYSAYLSKALRNNFGATLKEEGEVMERMFSKRKEKEKVKVVEQSEKGYHPDSCVNIR